MDRARSSTAYAARALALVVLSLAACPSPSTAPDAGAPASPDGAGPGPADAGAATADAGAGLADASSSAGPDASRPASCPFGDPGRTVGLLSCEQGAYEGYTLFAPVWSSTTFLVDMLGREVHRWRSSSLPGMTVYLLDSGELLRTVHKSMFGGVPTGGGLQRLAWDGTVTWDFEFGGPGVAPHHDVAPLPNGNVLLLFWETKSETDVIAKGYAPSGPVWSEALAEIRPTGAKTGEIVWEWHLWDHVLPGGSSPAQNPGLLALDYTRNDWLHLNSVSYSPELDQVVLSSRNLSELWVIDHGTTTAEAASHAGGKRGSGGDFLYRWGRPANWGAPGEQQLFGQHNVHWIAPGLPGAGHLLLFNNGNGRGWSTIDELVTPVDAAGGYPAPAAGEAFGPAAPAWRYQATPPTAFYANHISGTQRLPNGDTLVCAGDTGEIFEVTAAGAVVWRYRSPVGRSGVAAQGTVPKDPDMFRAVRFAADSPALAGRDLTPGAALEDAPGTTTDPGLAGDCKSSEDCQLCCASMNLVGYDKLVGWMSPCICGTGAKPGPCAAVCAEYYCAPVPSAAAPDEACSACASTEANGGSCTSVREKCLADAECFAFQSCRLGCL
ncbi:MAG TPA: aryl-sulfate sulfotransferase [Myxococcales bacterium]|jgi:hypothetical protein